MEDLPTYHLPEERLQQLNDRELDKDGNFLLYWMQHSQRAYENPALEYAIRWANDLDTRCVVAFALTDDYPDGNLRHFQFMLEGLKETADRLTERDLKFCLLHGAPNERIHDFATDAIAVVTDRGYLRIHRKWRKNLAQSLKVPLVQVEGDLVVPVETASEKREYAARTIRDQLMDRIDDFSGTISETKPKNGSKRMQLKGDLEFGSVSTVLDKMTINRDVKPSPDFTGGTSRARKRLTSFLRSDLKGYADGRLDPVNDATSHMSPYLHLGQISPCEVLRKIQDSSAPRKDRDDYIEELIVRRELTHNFVYYAPDDYDSINALPDWAAETLEKHKSDDRPDHYTRDELENGKTDDPAWNAAMREMRERGFLPNYMRMYWGKQIIRWTNTPDYAYKTALYLNNKYFLDGRDANSFANVLWLFGLHDRAWGENDVFGKVRVMSKSGLEKKFDVEGYIERVKSLNN